MTKVSASQRDKLLNAIDIALGQCPPLTGQQLDDVERLRKQLHDRCRDGDLMEAKRCQALALVAIRNGAPVPE